MDKSSKWCTILILIFVIGALPTACKPISFPSTETSSPVSTTLDSSILQTSTNIPIPPAFQIAIVHIGSSVLEAKYQPEFHSITDFLDDLFINATYDFDIGQTNLTSRQGNDIGFGLTEPNPDSILILYPVFGALGRLIKAGQPSFVLASEEFKFEKCLIDINEFGHGSTPIPSVGSYYCWATNEGRIVGFVVEKIEKMSGTLDAFMYNIEISYIVWDIIPNK